MTSPCWAVRAAAASLLLVLASCASGPTVPSASHGLELSVQVVRFGNHLDIQPSFTSVLRNGSSEEITVVFGTSCTVRPYITNGRSDEVYPGWEGCYQAVTPVTLASGASISRTLQLERDATPVRKVGTVALPPGRYVAYAEIDGSLRELGGQHVQLRTRGVMFEVP